MRRAARRPVSAARYLKVGAREIRQAFATDSAATRRSTSSSMPFEDFADRRARETARCQKARLLRPLGRRFGKLAEFLAPDGLSAREFGFAQLRAGFFDERLVDRMLLQFADDPARAQSRRAPMNQTFRETRVGQPVFGFQRVEHGIERIGFLDERLQFARQFGAAVFAAGQIAERAPFQRTCRALGFFGFVLPRLRFAGRATRAGVGGLGRIRGGKRRGFRLRARCGPRPAARSCASNDSNGSNESSSSSRGPSEWRPAVGQRPALAYHLMVTLLRPRLLRLRRSLLPPLH